MAGSADVLIVGGGVIGLTAAYYLALENVSITLIDRGHFGQEASWAGAGILPPASSVHAENALEQLQRLSVLEFSNLSADLLRQTGIDDGYRVCGGLEFLAGAAAGHPGEWSGTDVEAAELDEAATHIREPALGRNLGYAVYLPGLAQVRNPWHMRALIESCRLLGVRLEPQCACLDVVSRGDRIEGVRTSKGELACSQLLITTGAWSAELVQKLGCRVPVRPVRGQIVLYNTQRPVLRHVLMWGTRYLVPRQDGRVLVGSTEEEAGFAKQTTDEAISSLSALAAQMVPLLANSPIEKTWAGLRPGTPDGKPCLGRLPGWRNAFLAAGHFRAGIQLSPGTGIMCRDLLLDRKPSISLESLRPDRFSTGGTDPAFPS
jgi:glycine oxidase